MKNFNIFKTILAIALLGGFYNSGAQIHPLSFGAVGGSTVTNFYKDYVGVRLTVTAPAAVAGDKAYSIANNGSGATGEWGGAITTIMSNIQAIRPEAGNTGACSGIATDMSGKIAIIDRGVCEFGAKALAAQTANAVACVIVNNIPGAPVGMAAGAQGAGVIIPVFMISQTDGQAIEALLDASTTVTISITPWGFNLAHDLGIIAGGGSIFHDYAIPAEQLATGNYNPEAYQNLSGAYIGNFGNSTETNVKMITKMQFTPTGGSASTLHQDTVSFASFPTLDSIDAIFAPNLYDVHVSGTGKMDITYTVSSDATDLSTGNNTATFTSYATDNIYSKSVYDFANHVPVSSISFGSAGTNTWGPMYFVAKGGKGLDSIQFELAQTAPTSGGPNIFSASTTPAFWVFKWIDGFDDGTGTPFPKDGIMETGELQLVAQNTYLFDGLTDSSGEVFSLKMMDANDLPNPILLEDTTWYWVTCEVPPAPSPSSQFFLGCDGADLNYLPRTFGIWHHFADAAGHDSTHMENYNPLWPNEEDSIFLGPNNIVIPIFPFDRSFTENLVATPDSAVFHNQRGLVTTIPMITTHNNVSVKNVTGTAPVKIDIYPNPVSDNLNVSVGLDNTAKNLTYIVIDGLARTVFHEQHHNVQNENFTISAKTFAPGIYYLSVIADGKMVTRKFIVSK